HPDYLSTKYALDLDGVDLAGVQHHHAHIASCLADNGEEGPVIGVAFDGTGFGTDGTIWGGEFLLADLAGFERAGHLEPVPMPGGAAAIRQPWRMASAYLDAADAGEVTAGLEVAGRNAGRWPDVVAMARRGINAPLTSSAGRLFDAVAARVGWRDTINYEGQAAIELEQLADPAERGAYRASIDPGAAGPGGGAAPLRVRAADLVRAAAGLVGGGAGDSGARRRAAGHRRPVPPRRGGRHRGGLRRAVGTVRAGHGGAVRRRVPEPAGARPGRGPAGGIGVPGAHARTGAAQRRRDQLRPSGGGRCPRPPRRALNAGAGTGRSWAGGDGRRGRKGPFEGRRG